MKATLTFKLPEDEEEFQNATKGSSYRLALWDLDQFLRNYIKYPKECVSDDRLEAYQEVRDKLYSLLNEGSLEI